MIQRKRPARPPKSLNLSDPESAGSKELLKIKQWIEGGRLNPKKERPAFAAYKGADVVSVLEKLFENRCAYCEAPYGATQPVEVEHWRPKAEITGVADHGYEWLAMEWANLLPSCIDCNRTRYQLVPNLSTVSGWELLLCGKGNQFPLQSGSPRMNSPASIVKESPLLLDPCADDPSKFFDFPESGIILPKAGLVGLALERAVTSIRVYALNRKGLVDERRRHILWLELDFRMIRFLYKATGDPEITRLPPDFCRNAEALLNGVLERLQELAGGKMPYSQFIASRIRKFAKEELGIEYTQTNSV